MATEAARLERKESTERKKRETEKNTLDSYRPSHGRHLSVLLSIISKVRAGLVAGSE
jgi:hypothetical protein